MSTLTVGDTRPILTGQALNGDSGAVVTGATAELHIRRPDGAVLVVTPTWTNTVIGTWSYTWVVGDLSIAGVWEVDLRVTYSDTGEQTFGPIRFPVKTGVIGPAAPALPVEPIIDGGTP